VHSQSHLFSAGPFNTPLSEIATQWRFQVRITFAVFIYQNSSKQTRNIPWRE